MQLPLFPLATVLYPGALLPLRIFEPRYVELMKNCVKDGSAFGVCLITRGSEVATPGSAPPEFAKVGTQARIVDWDMPEPGIFAVRTTGGERFEVLARAERADRLIVADIAPIPPEPRRPPAAAHAPLVKLLEALATKIGPQRFPAKRAFDDASWVGYRLAEILPLPLAVKQGMLEINDSELRLATIRQFLEQQGVL
jgi:Lon protease-like protein